MSQPVASFYELQATRHHSARAYGDLRDWLAHLTLKNRADRTLDDYERTVAALLIWSDKAVEDYTVEDLEHFLIEKYGARKPGARIRMAHLRGFFKFLYDRDRIPKNIGARLEMPRVQKQKVIEVFTDAELALIYAADPLAVLLCETGMRKSEARNLQRRHINLKTGELVIYKGKGNKDRVVPLTSKASMVIADMDLMDGLEPEHHLWPTGREGSARFGRSLPISDTTMQKWWADPKTGVLARAGVFYRNMHTTRHTFATRLIRRGARIENVKNLMGHTSIQTTVDLYGHLDVEDARSDLLLLEAEVLS